MGLSGARAANKYRVAFGVEESTGGKLANEPLIDRRIGEDELVEILEDRELGCGDAIRLETACGLFISHCRTGKADEPKIGNQHRQKVRFFRRNYKSYIKDFIHKDRQNRGGCRNSQKIGNQHRQLC
jgi:hypothetical protein